MDDGSAAWEAGTWEGARRARIRRALALTVRERLLALDELARTSRRLARAGVEARERDREGGSASSPGSSSSGS